MAETMNVNILTFPLADAANNWQGGTVTGHLFRAPSAAYGGDVTITEAYAVNAAATGAGTGFTLRLENWGTAGTAIKTTGGTVAAKIGGTGDVWVADTAKNFTLSNPHLLAGEYLVLSKAETNSSDPTRGVVVIHYLHGE